MPAANPLEPSALPVQGPDPTGNQGWPISVVGAPGGDPVNVAITPGSGTVDQGNPNAGGTLAWPVTEWGVRDATGNPDQVGIDRLDEASGTAVNQHIGMYVLSMLYGRNAATNFLNILESRSLSSVPLAADFGLITNATLWGVRGTTGNFERIFLDRYDQADNVSVTGQEGVYSLSMGFKVASGLMSMDRGVDTFKTVATAALGNTALWTPAAGKKFRLMRYMIEVTGNSSFAAAAVITISLFDGAAGVTGQVHSTYIPLAAAITPGDNFQSGWIDLGNGYLSAAANNVLNVNLSAALAVGTVRVLVAGTEE